MINPLPTAYRLPPTARGFTLVELIVSVGLFALVMTLVTGAYLIMIGINRQVQASATGINNLSFALEDMTRSIRTGTNYVLSGGSFSFRDSSGNMISYARSTSSTYCGTGGGGCIVKTKITTYALTDPSVNITSLMFYPVGTMPGDVEQSRVTMIVSGTVSSGPGKTESFTIQTGATMRGSDI